MKKYLHYSFQLLFISFVSISIAFAVPSESTLKYKDGIFSFYVSHSLSVINPDIKKAIIVVHGSARNADTYYRSIELLAKRTDNLENTIIVSPHFKNDDDHLLDGEFVWSYYGWWEGDQSLTMSSVSSFDIIDNFVNLLVDSNKFPNIETVIITGHSAGGQLTQHYAVGSPIEDKFAHIKFKYIVANPGAYLYLTPMRPILDQEGEFYIPTESRCMYDNYKYGMQKLNPYMAKGDVAAMVKRYVDRDVTYFLGEDDVLEDIDQSCAARLQGRNRLQRGRKIKQFMDFEFPNNLHKIITVPNVGHTQWGMYTSSIASDLLF